jgi:hypothetical protein
MSKQRFKKRKKQISKTRAVGIPTALLFLGMFKLFPSVFDNEKHWKL